MKNLIAFIFIILTLVSCGDDLASPPGYEEWVSYRDCIVSDPDLATLSDSEKEDLSDSCRIPSDWEGYCYWDDLDC